MNTTLRSIRVGLFFVIGVALLYVVYDSLSNRKIGQRDGYTVVAAFEDLKQLLTGDDVRMAGVKIGAIQETKLRDGKAIAVLKIADEYKIPRDSVATIAIASLLGTNHVSISYGDAAIGYLPDSAQIATEESPDITSIIKQVDKIGDKLDELSGAVSGFASGAEGGPIEIGKGVNNLFTKLNDLMDDSGPKLDRILSNIDSITQKLADGRGTLGKLISDDAPFDKLNQTLDNLHAVSEKLNSGHGTLGKLVNDDSAYNDLSDAIADLKAASKNAYDTMSGAEEIIQKIKSGEGTLGSLIYRDELSRKLEAVVLNFSEFSERLNSEAGTLGKLVNDDTLYNELLTVLQKASRTMDDVGESGPITAVGVVTNSLF